MHLESNTLPTACRTDNVILGSSNLNELVTCPVFSWSPPLILTMLPPTNIFHGELESGKSRPGATTGFPKIYNAI